MSEIHVAQTVTAQIFQRSQEWVSRYQRRAKDPMPRDLEGAIAWGKRLGFLGGKPQPPAPSQATLAQMFFKSQMWVSRKQRIDVDPMPADLKGAMLWGRRHGFLKSAPIPSPSPTTPAQSAPLFLEAAQ